MRGFASTSHVPGMFPIQISRPQNEGRAMRKGLAHSGWLKLWEDKIGDVLLVVWATPSVVGDKVNQKEASLSVGESILRQRLA